ncbi:translation initiation factor IF-2-like [Felis catus]|uniref:translation initiation factor IF-2-like n=1 Tax=Felis catus TaxID=9685 RepID=UPI001D1A2EF6|nr:translation initiation factor IF-2-like [Felis catus]
MEIRTSLKNLDPLPQNSFAQKRAQNPAMLGWGPVCRCLWGGRPGEKRTGHLPSTAPPRGCRAALSAHRGGGRPALPCPALPTPRRPTGRRSSASPPLAAEAAAAAAARARLRKPAGARRAAEVDRRHPALASPPPASSLSPPCPRWRRLRRRALRRLSRSRPGPPFPPHGVYIGAPRPHPPARAASGRPGTAPFRGPCPAAAGRGPRRAFVPGRAAAGSRSREGAFSPRLRRLQGTRWARCVAESQPAVDPAALPNLADCMRYPEDVRP